MLLILNGKFISLQLWFVMKWKFPNILFCILFRWVNYCLCSRIIPQLLNNHLAFLVTLSSFSILPNVAQSFNTAQKFPLLKCHKRFELVEDIVSL
jgi:hypothetical protein